MGCEHCHEDELQGYIKTNFGYELILDLYGCDKSLLESKSVLAEYNKKVVKIIDMVAVGEPIIPDAFGEGNLHGLSSIQFIETSSIVCHTFAPFLQIHINIFSCKEFDPKPAIEFSKEFFKAKGFRERFIDR